jgi:hypothetical protein
VYSVISALLEAWLSWSMQRLMDRWRITRAIKKALAVLVGALAVCFCLNNCYWLLVDGVLYWPGHRRTPAGWISFSDAPVTFVFWSAISSLPFLVAAIYAFGFFALRRRSRRDALRRFTDGIAPPSIVEIMDPATGRSDRPPAGPTPPG